MVQRLSCPQGHQWENLDSQVVFQPACPVCGRAATTLPTNTLERTPDVGRSEEFVAPTLPSPSDRLPMPANRPALEIPGYEVLGELGRGGAGVVYKARQTALSRLVALKVLASGPYAGAAELARFQSEAEAVARLRHPNIVQIHDLGEANGRPYFALEYVPGGSLAAKLAGKPQPPRQAAEMTMVLARAVHFAHQQGILHRDLKPGNVLLDADGTPKVADFGLARRLEIETAARQEQLTPSGIILGTPSYMAPEQARGDTRQLGRGVDVYALGGILYEMLTGRPPFLGDTLTHVLHQVIDAEPIAPRRLNPGVPRDLETICLRCLEKRPAGRYASAADLADDLQRFLDGQPIRARPVGQLERALKWMRRRPAQAALLGFIVLALLLGIAGGIGHNLQLQQKNDALAEALAAKEQQRQRNTALLRGDLEAMKDYGDYLDSQLQSLPRLTGVREKLLRKRLEFFNPILEKEPNDPELRQTQGLAFLAVGVIQQKLGQYEQAESCYRQALARLERPAAEETPESRRWLARVHVQYGTLLNTLHRDEEANRHLQQGEHLLTRLAAETPDAETRRALALACHNRAVFLVKTHRFEEAQQAYARAIDLRRQLMREEPRSDTYPRELVGSYLNLAGLYLKRHQLGSARTELQRAEEILRTQAHDAEYRNLLAGRHINLGMAEQDEAPERALDDFQQAFQLWSGLHDDFPDVPDYRRNLASASFLIGVQYRQMGRLPQAVQRFRHSLALYRDLLRQSPESALYQSDVAQTLDHLAGALHSLKQDREAEILWREQLALLEKMLRTQPQKEILRQKISFTLGELGDVDAIRGMDLQVRPPLLLAPVAAPLAIVLHDLANLSYGRAYLARASASYRRGIAEERRLLKVGPPQPIYYVALRRHARSLGLVAWHVGNYADLREAAEAMAEAAAGLPNDADNRGAAYRSAAAGQAQCARMATRAGQLRRASLHAEQAVELLGKAVASGFRNADDLERAPEFAVLRTRPDFQDLLRRLREKM